MVSLSSTRSAELLFLYYISFVVLILLSNSALYRITNALRDPHRTVSYSKVQYSATTPEEPERVMVSHPSPNSFSKTVKSAQGCEILPPEFEDRSAEPAPFEGKDQN